jgi:arabinan endo-1,5-alpha-L-arabinosidase
MHKLTLLCALAGLSACAAPLATPPATYANPVFDSDFPDPTVVRAADGYYYAYATQGERGGKMANIQVTRSSDLRQWDYVGDALPAKPVWASQTQDFWAPHVSERDGRYFLYYSAKPDAALKDDKKGLCLAVASGTSPAGPFVDMGHPLKCGESFVNIDPMVFDDPATGKRLYYWGSGFQPIRVQELASDNMSFAPGSAPKDLVWPNPKKDAFPVLVEGPWVVRRGDYYYMFYSGDNCCGPKANYAVMVARSRSATGPFETLEQANGTPNSIILQKSDRWIAPGHNSIVTDAAGVDWIVYHAVDARRPRTKPTDDLYSRRVMLIDRIEWRDGWPHVVGPTVGPQPGPIFR